MIFTCDNCGFSFSQSSASEQCPDCGKSAVRPANRVEQEEFTARLPGTFGDGSSALFPDIVKTHIEEINCFKFKLPATALQIDSRMLLEIVVEHGISPGNPEMVVANVWARPAACAVVFCCRFNCRPSQMSLCWNGQNVLRQN